MATDQAFDPDTRDYITLPNGDWQENEDSRTAVVFQLESELNAWWGDPKAGSRNAALGRSDEPTEPEQYQDSTKRALMALASAGLISDVAVTIDDYASERRAATLLLEWFDRASNGPADLSYTPLGNAP